MKPSFLVAGLAFAFVGVLGAEGCKAGGVGDPCTPEQQYDQSFLGFNVSEVNVESKSFQCQTRLCLVNHFRGRVGCLYGQNADGTKAEDAAESCATPSGRPVTGKDSSGNFADPVKKARVEPQCTDRREEDAVYCSCRCADVNGKTDDGASYCTCPSGFECTPLVTSIGPTDQGLTGSYCVKSSAKFKPENNCTASCTGKTCPSAKK